MRRPATTMGATALSMTVTLAAISSCVLADEQKPSCADDAMLVFDASGSMAATDFPEGAPSRMDRVRQALLRVLPAASNARRLGLVVYGPGPNANTCKNVDLRLPPTANAGERILSEVDKLRPTGRTALTSSVQQAAEILHHENKPAVVVVLTDGQDTCGGDACRLAHELKQMHPAITVHVIGYRLYSLRKSAPVRGTLPCRRDRGIYATAETTEQLAEVLAEMLGCPAVTFLAPTALIR